MDRGCVVRTPTPPLSGRRTPRQGPACVCVPALLGRVGRVGLLGAFWCASPFLWPFCPSSLFCPLRAVVARASGVFFVFFSFLFLPLSSFLPSRAPAVSGFLCSRALGALGFGALRLLLHPPPAPSPPFFVFFPGFVVLSCFFCFLAPPGPPFFVCALLPPHPPLPVSLFFFCFPPAPSPRSLLLVFLVPRALALCVCPPPPHFPSLFFCSVFPFFFPLRASLVPAFPLFPALGALGLSAFPPPSPPAVSLSLSLSLWLLWPASTCPAQPPSKARRDSPRGGGRHHGDRKADRSTQSDRTGRGAAHQRGATRHAREARRRPQPRHEDRCQATTPNWCGKPGKCAQHTTNRGTGEGAKDSRAPTPAHRTLSQWVAGPGPPPRGRAVGRGRAPDPGRPTHRQEAPPTGALMPPPQRAKPARKSARCRVGAGSPRPHPRHPQAVGRGPRLHAPKDARSGVEERPTSDAPHTGKRRPHWAPSGRPHSAQTQLARARAVGVVTCPHACTPRTHSQWVVGIRPHAPRDGRSGLGERPTLDAPHTGKRRPPRAPSCRLHSTQSQLARARAVCWETGPQAHDPHTHSQWVVGPGRTPQGREVERGGSPQPGRPTRRQEAPPQAPWGRHHSAQSQLARARAVGLVTGPNARSPQNPQPVVSGPPMHAPRTGGRAWEGARPRTLHTQARGAFPGRPRAVPTARKASSQERALWGW